MQILMITSVVGLLHHFIHYFTERKYCRVQKNQLVAGSFQLYSLHPFIVYCLQLDNDADAFLFFYVTRHRTSNELHLSLHMLRVCTHGLAFLLFTKFGQEVLVFMFSATKEVSLYNWFAVSFSLVIINITSLSHL